MKASIILLAVLGTAWGATYEKGLPVDGEQIQVDGPVQPSKEDLEAPQEVPNEADTLHEGLNHKGDPRHRAVTGSLATSDASVQTQIVNEHNRLRRIVPSTDSFKMSWDAEAQKIAQGWADKCNFAHPSTQAERDAYLKTSKYGCGQNIAMGTGAMTWNQTIGMWYNEIKDFTYGQTPAGGKIVGHYTAIVWAKSYAVGCGYKLCKAGTSQQFHFFVCDYCPAGNMVPNQYKPYTPGTKCGKCPSACDNGLCTNPCPYTNDLSNCEVSSGSYPPLFPTVPCPSNSLTSKCKATCNCKGKLLY